MTQVIVLRPEPGASATVDRARQRGLDARAIPLFEIHPITWDPPEVGGFDGILLTSANAIRHGGDGLLTLRGLPVYAVGAATAEAARDAGFDVASVGDKGVERLLGSIDAELRLLHLAGSHRTEVANARQAIETKAVYDSRPIEGADLADCRDCVVLIHSPRAGARFAELSESTPLDKPTIAIAANAPDAADAVGKGWKTIEAAGEPGDDALLALAERLCNNLAGP